MIITVEEISQFKKILNSRDPRRPLKADEFLRNNPHILLVSGFDEVRIAPYNPDLEKGIVNIEETCRRLGVNPISLGSKYSLDYYRTGILRVMASIELRLNLTCRRLETGEWYKSIELGSQGKDGHCKPLVLIPYNNNLDRLTDFHEGNSEVNYVLSFEKIIANCERSLSSPVEFGAIILPNLWRPPERHPKIELVSGIKDILLNLKKGNIDLKDISWRQLEELVAELLKARGMEVEVTSSSGDGGRDIIVRGELIPGESMVLAVEVKHKDVVSIDDVRSRLYANKDFPAVMFATSGRFSAGVVREKKKPENFLRMFLKDNHALRQWIDEYNIST